MIGDTREHVAGRTRRTISDTPYIYGRIYESIRHYDIWSK
jgi:hypothetical protein